MPKGIYIHQKGMHHSQATIEKMRISASKRITPKWPDDRRLRFANSKRGSKSFFWKGGITETNKLIRSMFEYKLWREVIFVRDNWTCQMCGNHGCHLHVDHIKSLHSIIEENNLKTVEDALNCSILWNIGNGRVLCIPCHKTTDTYTGRIFKK